MTNLAKTPIIRSMMQVFIQITPIGRHSGDFTILPLEVPGVQYLGTYSKGSVLLAFLY